MGMSMNDYEKGLLHAEEENYRLRREAYQLRMENADLRSAQESAVGKIVKAKDRAAEAFRKKLPSFPGNRILCHDFTKGPRAEYTKDQLRSQKKESEEGRPLISLLVSVHNTSEYALREFLSSVQDQTFGKMEVCIADASDEAHRSVSRILAKATGNDHRFLYRKISPERVKDARNIALKMASGSVIVLARPEDLLHPAALWRFQDEMEHSDADILYCDEAVTAGDPAEPVSFLYKSDYGPEDMEGMDLFGHLVAIRRSLLTSLLREKHDKRAFRVEQFDYKRAFCVERSDDQSRAGMGLPDDRLLTGLELTEAQDYDLLLRLSGRTQKIRHISEVLCFRRVDAFQPDTPATREADTLAAKGTDTAVTGTVEPALVSIIICNRDSFAMLNRCVTSIFEKTTWKNYEILICENGSTDKDTLEYYAKLQKDPRIRVLEWPEEKEFNFAAVNNFGARQSRGEYIVLLNNDTEVITENWIEELLAQAQKKQVGAVGCMLLYPDGTIQHAGMVVRPGDSTAHMNLYEDPDSDGYLGRFHRVSNVSSVTAACLMICRSVWNQMNGMDESFRVAYNDVDLCLRLRKAGYRTVFTPFARLYHYEGQTRGFRRMEEGDVSLEAKEADLFHRRHSDLGWNDPFYNRHFFSADGHFWERIPEETETRMRRLFAPYRHLPVYVTEGEARKYLEQIGASGLDVIVSDIPGEGLSEDPDGKIPIVLGGKTPEVPALEGEYLYLVDPEHLDIVRPGDRMVFATGGFAGFVTDGFIRDSTKESIGETGAGSKRNPVNEKHSAGSAQRKKVVCDVEADHFLGKGFHAPESGQAWAAEEEASIWLMLSKADQKLEIEQGHSIPLEALGWKEIILTFSVNDHRIGTGRIDAHNNGKTITISLPAAAVRDGLNKLTVSCRLWSPADLGGADRRLLGFSLKKITAKKRR